MMTSRIKARILAESQHLMIDPDQLENLPGYPRMRGGFGTVKVVRFNGNLMALKNLHIDGNDDERIRFAIVRRHIQLRRSSRAVLSLPFNAEICTRADSLGAA